MTRRKRSRVDDKEENEEKDADSAKDAMYEEKDNR